MANRSQTSDVPIAKWRERYAALKRLPSFLRIVWETNHPLTILVVSLRLLTAFFPVGNLLIVRKIVNIVAHAIQYGFIDMETLWILLAAGLILAILADILARLIRYTDNILTDQVSHNITVKMIRKSSDIALASFEDPAFRDKIDRARKQATSRASLMISFASILRQIVTLATMMVTIVVLSPWVLVLFLIATIPVFLGEARQAKRQYLMLFGQTETRRKMSYLESLSLNSQSAKEIKLYELADYIIERLTVLFDQSHQESRRLAAARTFEGAVLNLVPTITYWTTYAVIVVRALSLKATIGDITLISGAFTRTRDIVENLVGQVTDISEQALFLVDLFDFLEASPPTLRYTRGLRAPRPIKSGYEFRNVSFSYTKGSTSILNGINFHLRPGEKIAIVGENGAGKTTLIKLLAGLYEPTEGTILLDGVDLREYDPTDIRKSRAVMFQDYVRYEMKIAENIGFGKLEDLSNGTRIRSAAEKSRSAKFIEALPEGYEQMLGRKFEGGIELSTGQWQKVALARAYMRDAQLLILDEPTASLDIRTELEVFRNTLNLANQNQLVVLISHRFSTVRRADRILMMERGQIAETGSHEQLLTKGGKYAELFELQASGYR